MIRLNLRFKLMIAALGLAASGCTSAQRQTGHPSKPAEDPTSWSAPAVSREDDGSGAKSILKPSRRAGGWSSEANDIERSLGAIQ